MTSPFITTLGASRLTYIVVLIVGMALCTRGIGLTAAKHLWAHPISIAGYLLGALALLLSLQGILRFSLVPLQGALLLGGILGIIVVKILLGLAYRSA